MANKIELDKIDFKNLKSGNTPVNDDNLNQVQENVEKFGNVISSNAATNLGAEAKRATDKEKELEDKIKTLEDKNADLQSEIDILNSEFADNTVSGETAIVSDGVKGSKVEVIGDGNTYQETTEGYQAVDDSSVRDYTPTASGSYKIPFTPTKGEQYYFKLITDNPTVATQNAATITLYDLDGNSLGSISNTNNGAVNNAVNTLYTVTIDYDNVGYVGGYINYDAFKTAHKTIKGLLVSKVNSEILEPYTNGVASPSTEYEQPIEVITECSLVHRGKNCFNKDVSNIYATTDIIEEKIENGIKVSGKDTNSVSQYIVYPIGKLKNFIGKNVTISFDYKATNTNITDKNSFLVFCDKDGSNRVALVYNNIVGTSGKYFATAYNLFEGLDEGSKAQYDEDDVIAVRLYASGGTNTGIPSVEYTNIQVEFGETATEYEQGHYEVHSIDLAGNTLAKVGEIADLLNIGVDGSVKIDDKVIKQYVFTGDENWFSASSVLEGTSRFYFDKADVINNKDTTLYKKSIYSNRFKALAWLDIYGGDKTTIDGISVYDDYTGNGHRIVIRIDSNVASTVEELKSYLKENETYCYYVLEEEYRETINLPSISPITLFNGTNIFELVTNLGTTLAVTYKVSNKSRLEALENAILSLGGNI